MKTPSKMHFFEPMDVIFDIDGTLADCTHRQHFLRVKPKKWKEWEKGLKNDAPIKTTVSMYHVLKGAGCRIVLATGRLEKEREDTLGWLKEKCHIFPEKLYMRANGDYRDDGLVKGEMLDQMLDEGYDPVVVFDDRDRVVKMWRERGLTCYQTNYGAF